MTAASPTKTVVVTDMDETLICSKSTGYVINFLVQYKAWLRLAVTLPCALILIPLSKIKKPFDGRSLAVRIMYWLAFRGIRVDKAQKVPRSHFGPAVPGYKDVGLLHTSDPARLNPAHTGRGGGTVAPLRCRLAGPCGKCGARRGCRRRHHRQPHVHG